MRVIAGSARRLTLKTIEGMDTRPTTDRIKETLFNMIQNDIYDCSFLDLFAGSGAIGIEALSRGAEHAVFVEQSREAAGCVRDNLKAARLSEKAEVLELDVFAALKRLEGRQTAFTYIFMDPPYRQDLEKQVVEYLDSSALADADTVVIIEAAKDTDLSWLTRLGWIIRKEKIYKTNKHIFTSKGEK